MGFHHGLWRVLQVGRSENRKVLSFRGCKHPAWEILTSNRQVGMRCRRGNTRPNAVKEGASATGDSESKRTIDVTADAVNRWVNQQVDVEDGDLHLDGKHVGFAVGDESAAENGKPVAKSDMEVALIGLELQTRADENFSQNKNLFVNPPVAKPNQEIELFLNRSLTALNNEPDVVIKGAFNDWQWQPFTTSLSKSTLIGDWWCCKIFIPKEAYKMNFVFCNGSDLYENNDGNDFCIHVQNEVDEYSFADFLVEEEHREMLRIAEEEAELERRVEAQVKLDRAKSEREIDKARARAEVERKRKILQQVMEKAALSADKCYMEADGFSEGCRVRIFYNKSSGPLRDAPDIWIHDGYDNWQNQVSSFQRLVKNAEKGGDWWSAEVIVPDGALVLDWVFADGPPETATLYDNNNRQDFHAILPTSVPQELYWNEEEHRIYTRFHQERRLKEEAIEKTVRMKAAMKENTLKRFMLSRKHVVYTEPVDVRAGSKVTVLYNPSNTVLNGKAEIWFRCSFNRWTHRKGPLPPQRMVPAENSPHLKASVRVPPDAYTIDFVFSEAQGDGLYDNNNGMDYHIPVFGGITKEPPMHIVHIAVEMAPVAKVGGLGDVVTSLSRAVKDLNHNVDIILPKYDCLDFNEVKDLQYRRTISWSGFEIKVWFGKVEGLSVYFLEPQNRFFSEGRVYGCNNDGERFGFFCHAALEFLLQSGFRPDIIHCHDWSSAPVSWLFKDHYRQYGLSNTRVIFTIHNLEFGANLIAKAMQYSDRATTVSQTYAKEVSGNPAIAPHLHKFHGIINGIDPDIWDPSDDKFIPMSYTPDNVVEGKRAAKEALQRKLGLEVGEIPLVGVITRLTHQKGIHLIKHAIWRTLESNGQVVLLGSAPDPRIQNEFVGLANQLQSSHSGHAHLCLSYDEPLSHLIYAGADFILVPSIFEPCGLTQLTAMRYGSIPVVRRTGGLYDTVFDIDDDKERAHAQGLEPNGFSFGGADAAEVDHALNRAISSWRDNREWLNSLCKNVMEQDWSWNRPALEYIELYHAARK
uniref:starch synthase n=1 Tax=Kalanchoe fedtschenkoi TaxID=63787 RepID=A0A7N0SWD3_KALFE